ncbi:MAG: hypothetical protein IPJ67_04835 [Candidatus Moraniibacteriota bacterium]|nr:MAG: hypothetical protein IPJ67_04835 [Candidatus Moranbacteria bacterium]
MTMSLNEKVALLQSLEDISEPDRQIACGELLLLLLVALRQATSEEGIIALSEESRKLIEQEVIERVANVLTQCFGLETLYPGILNMDYKDVRRDLQGLMYQFSSSDVSDDLSHLVPWLFSGKSSHESIGKSYDWCAVDIERRMHDSRGDIQDCEEPTDEELLERMHAGSEDFAEMIRRTFKKME